MNQARKRTGTKKVLSMILVLVMLLSLLSMAAFTLPASETGNSKDAYEYNIMFLDCGRKYYSVDSIEKIIDNASAAGFNYIQLAVGNDGLRFLLDDMSLTVNGTTYSTERVADAIKAGNKAYNDTFNNKIAEDGKKADYSPTTNELTQSDMDTIIAYAKTKGMGVIPCVNTPGHMDAILSAANSLTGTTCSYSSSVRTIDVTNTTAVAFTKALLQKYITYFAGKGCKLFNMGADEYANDKFTGGAMGFGNLQSTGKYSNYVTYVNQVAKMIKDAGMKPMAFNDGIYFNNNTYSGTFDTDILICYWSSGWGSYNPMSAANLADKGFKLINTHGDYYWVLGKNAKCSAETASNFNTTAFYGSTVSNPVGSMFCIWADYPGAETEASVISKTAATIAAFGKALPTVKKVEAVESKTVAKGDVAVTAPGLTDLTVTATTAPTIDTAAEGKVSAYDVTPATEKGSYAGSGSVSLPIPEGWDASRVRGYVVNEDGSVTTGLTGTTADGKFTFTVPHFSRMGIYELAANAATETKEITLTVGGTKTETLAGDYSGTLLDDDFATVTGTVAEIPGKTTYKPAALGAGTFYVSTKSGDTAPTVQLTFEDAGNGQYYIKNSDGAYLYPTADYTAFLIWGSWKNYRVTTTNTKNADAAVKVVTNNDGSIVISKTVTSGGQSTTAYLTLSGKSFGAAENGTSLYLYDQQTTSGGKETTLTFTGKSVGTTKVTIGDTQYIIKVTAEDLSNVTPLTIEYWITNKKVTADGATSKQIKADSSVYSETGAKFSDLVPAEGKQDNNTDVFWKGTRLTSANKQTDESGVDQTRAGNDFTYIRYWNQKWSFSVDGKSWTDFNDDDQVVAYYLQKTDVTSEITTNVVDWGQPYSEWKAGGGANSWFWNGYVQNGSKYVFLDFAVVYEDNTQNPSSFPTDKTLFYHFDGCSETKPRVLGAISFTENSDYEIWKVTVTDGTSTGYSSYSTFAPTYDNTTETTVWDESMGGIPQIDQLKYTANRSGKLVRVYVRAKVTEDSLTVNYFDENNTSLPFYSYNIAVASGTAFSNQFTYVPGSANENGSLSNNTVVNIKGVTQTVNWQLEKMSEIGAQYRFGNYIFTNATKETGNKVVNLYYKFNSEKTFVVDFGLPLHITKTDISEKLSQANIEGVTVGNSLYGTVRANVDFSIDYILNKTIDGSDRITVTYTGTKASGASDSATYNLTIIPATSVYYEDSFASFTNADKSNGVNKKTDNGYWTTDGKTVTDAKQALEALGSQQNVYGCDGAYANSSKFSMGSATKVTVNADTSKLGQSPTATFTFTGTGFDVISLTGNQSGTVMYTVKNTKTGDSSAKIVNTYYGYKYENGKWETTNSADPNALYQIPVIKENLTYGTYEVTISVLYGDYFNSTANKWYTFWLDAIRVYNPMGKDKETYKQDGEGYPQYIKLHDQLAKENGSVTTNNKLLFIDGAAEANIADYKVYGPNNEVYLANGQAITFNVSVNSNIESIQIGAKAPDGKAAQMVVTGGNSLNKELSTATEMYYTIGAAGGSFTITNTGTGILSLTNLKITFKASGQTVTLNPLSTEAQKAAVMSVRALFAAPEQTFEPEYFTAKWSRNVRKGGTATLTVKASADVAAIKVNGVTVDSYRTRTERSGWGSSATKETYHVFTYQVKNAAAADYTIYALNADGVASDPIIAPLTVRPSIRDWWNGIFDKWKH